MDYDIYSTMTSFMDDDDTPNKEVANFDRKPQKGGANLRKSEKIEDDSFDYYDKTDLLAEIPELPYCKYMDKFARRSIYRIIYYKYDYYTMKDFVKLFNKNVEKIIKFFNSQIPAYAFYGLFTWKQEYKSNGSIHPIICASETKSKEDGFIFITGPGIYYASAIKVFFQVIAKAAKTKISQSNYRAIKYKGLDHDKSFIFVDKAYAEKLKSFTGSL